jgi:adenylylsulfate kinase
MSWALWITGRPGSGKSTLARAAAARLADRGRPVAVIELDVMRQVLTPTPTYSDTEREVVYRSLVFAATALVEAGVPVIIDATSHRRAWREMARAMIARFAEVQLDCPLGVAESRERTRTAGVAPPAIYAGASHPGATVPGVNVPYERALAPELTIDTSLESAEAAAERITEVALTLGPAARAPLAPGGAVVWLTGLPGSGKSTLAGRLAERLTLEGVATTVLEWTELKSLALAGAGAGEHGEEIAHRALAYAAKLLADAGLVVIVDATAARRRWRTLARELAGTFAEVQLVCPPEICLGRERAVRWAAPGTGRPVSLREGLELAIEYEYSLAPDLTLDTEVRSEWTAAEDLASFARRLLARSVIRQGG